MHSSTVRNEVGSYQTLLIAETDLHTLASLPGVLSDAFPHVSIDVCTSAEGLGRTLQHTSYDTVAISLQLVQGYHGAMQKRPLQFLAPLLVTASPDHRRLAEVALETGNAFDVIATPIVPTEVIQSVRLALWQNRLLRLLTSKERVMSRFHEHMAAFPHARKAEAEFLSKLAAYDRTFRAIQSSMRLLVTVDDERALFQMTRAVEQLTKQQALDRLFNLCKQEGPSQ